MEKPIRVLVVDDSALMRELLGGMLAEDPGIVVVGKARDGQDAIKKVADLRPDVVTLDVQMPGMDGIAALDFILEKCPIPIIMVSALTQHSADITLQALEHGAADYVPKPEQMYFSLGPFRKELVHKVRTVAGTDVTKLLRMRRPRTPQVDVRPAPSIGSKSAPIAAEGGYENCCIAIGISTGGPPVLSALFQALTPPLPPIVVVQHMPRLFTGPFARRLDSISSLSIKEAEHGDLLLPNQVLIARGGLQLHLQRQGAHVIAQIGDDEPVSGHHPSVDVMMRDAAAVFGRRCLGTIMTGMGHDGAAGCAAIRAAGGYVLGQDAATSDVYGMNRVAFVNGAVDRQFAVNELPQLIARQCAKLFPSKRTALASV